MGYLYFASLVLYAVAFGLLGFGIFTLFSRSNQKRGSIAIISGVVIFVAVMSANVLYPVSAGEKTIVANYTNVSSADDSFYCEIYDEYTNAHYRYYSSEKEEATAFCSNIELGKEYSINYTYKDGSNHIETLGE
ncbi:hypothetical protein [Bacillus sp. PS06]|uniref:hypothetical protein n=1 Tax=Bacillus sp. PS06 TaxID=2764176 RepID=UPI0017803DE4|nr:hypothetical protein [Bacillus sp. PS06]MBD8071421.1 hypothetical protein [Bacillus sp. PS06]